MSQPKASKPFQSTVARVVLHDCRLSLSHLEKDPIGPEWRIRWVTMLALLRTVGEALRHADGKRAKKSNAKDAMELEVAAFRARLNTTKPDPAIYWAFIHEDSNNILHQYRFAADQAVHVNPHTILAPEINDLIDFGVLVRDAAEVSYPIRNGPFAGQDQRHVVRQAIDWWEEQINEIETRAAAHHIQP